MSPSILIYEKVNSHEEQKRSFIIHVGVVVSEERLLDKGQKGK